VNSLFVELAPTKHPSSEEYDHRREVYETPEQKLRSAIIKLGEVVRIQRPLFHFVN
jgi:hypothetical protein